MNKERRIAVNFTLTEQELADFVAKFSIPADGDNRSKTLRRITYEPIALAPAASIHTADTEPLPTPADAQSAA